ncbi:hypothetical protein FTUN_6342 [Frigoriglobus tundricola]|uniref:Uncharacterized protein n=1 Tax=Frigoriglobus tundricola TaxID=2774151 RepID=A0A6M5YXA3_9BACT|nr:hypothetical protein FTUN_6342 [Frigoriglobus tundricola]
MSLSGFRLVAQAFEPVLQGTQARKPVPRKQTLAPGSCMSVGRTLVTDLPWDRGRPARSLHRAHRSDAPRVATPTAEQRAGRPPYGLPWDRRPLVAPGASLGRTSCRNTDRGAAGGAPAVPGKATRARPERHSPRANAAPAPTTAPPPRARTPARRGRARRSAAPRALAPRSSAGSTRPPASPRPAPRPGAAAAAAPACRSGTAPSATCPARSPARTRTAPSPPPPRRATPRRPR